MEKEEKKYEKLQRREKCDERYAWLTKQAEILHKKGENFVYCWKYQQLAFLWLFCALWKWIIKGKLVEINDLGSMFERLNFYSNFGVF